jgi:hypothetical protein
MYPEDLKNASEEERKRYCDALYECDNRAIEYADKRRWEKWDAMRAQAAEEKEKQWQAWEAAAVAAAAERQKG